MAISFPDDSMFDSKFDTKLTLMISADMKESLDELGVVLNRDISKTVRWCLEQILREAISQGKISNPRKSA